MGGVDLADQTCGLYEYDRKSDKWWKKVMVAVNARAIYHDLNRKKMTFKSFLITLAEELIQEGLQTTAIRRSFNQDRMVQWFVTTPQATRLLFHIFHLLIVYKWLSSFITYSN